MIARYIWVNIFFLWLQNSESTLYLLKQWLLVYERKQGIFFPLMPPCVNEYGNIVTQTAIFPHIILTTCLWYHFFNMITYRDFIVMFANWVASWFLLNFLFSDIVNRWTRVFFLVFHKGRKDSKLGLPGMKWSRDCFVNIEWL